jgi:hypothetical protein
MQALGAELEANLDQSAIDFAEIEHSDVDVALISNIETTELSAIGDDLDSQSESSTHAIASSLPTEQASGDATELTDIDVPSQYNQELNNERPEEK